jgi:hypothetical protein
MAVITSDQSQVKVDYEEKGAHQTFFGPRGSTFYMPDGKCLQFSAKGEYETDSVAEQKELKAASDKPGSPLFTQGHSGPVIQESDRAPAEEVKNRAAEVVADLKKQARV